MALRVYDQGWHVEGQQETGEIYEGQMVLKTVELRKSQQKSNLEVTFFT